MCINCNLVCFALCSLSGGELFDQIADEDYKMTEAEVIHYIKQICDGLCHMHEQNIVHLDVKVRQTLDISGLSPIARRNPLLPVPFLLNLPCRQL